MILVTRCVASECGDTALDIKSGLCRRVLQNIQQEKVVFVGVKILGNTRAGKRYRNNRCKITAGACGIAQIVIHQHTTGRKFPYTGSIKVKGQ